MHLLVRTPTPTVRDFRPRPRGARSAVHVCEWLAMHRALALEGAGPRGARAWVRLFQVIVIPGHVGKVPIKNERNQVTDTRL